MRNFDLFFQLHFDSKEISDDELNSYTTENIKLLATTPRFASTTAALLTAHTSYFGAITDEATNAAIQKGQTQAMKDARDAFEATLSRHEGTIRGKFGVGSAEYLRFFPAGLSEYRESSLSTIDQKLTRLLTAFTDIGTKLDPAVVAEFTEAGTPTTPAKGVILVFQNVRASQLAAKAATTASKSPSATNRAALEVACQKALLTVALDALDRTPAERTELRRLFPQHLLENRAHATTATTTPVTPA